MTKASLGLRHIGQVLLSSAPRSSIDDDCDILVESAATAIGGDGRGGSVVEFSSSVGESSWECSCCEGLDASVAGADIVPLPSSGDCDSSTIATALSMAKEPKGLPLKNTVAVSGKEVR